MCAESHSKSVTELKGTPARLLHRHDSYARCQLSPLCAAGHPSTWSPAGAGEEVEGRGGGGRGGQALTSVVPSPRDPWPLDYSVYTFGGLGQHRPQHGGARGTSRARPHSQHGGRCGDHSDGQLSARSDPRHRRQPHPCLLFHPGRCGCGPGGLHCLQEVREGMGDKAGSLLSSRA